MFDVDAPICLLVVDEPVCLFEVDEPVCLFEVDEPVCLLEVDEPICLLEVDEPVCLLEVEVCVMTEEACPDVHCEPLVAGKLNADCCATVLVFLGATEFTFCVLVTTVSSTVVTIVFGLFPICDC